MDEAPVALRTVEEIAPQAQEVVSRFRQDNADILGAEVHHIGATAIPFGHTKGDVDVNVRVDEAAFAPLLAALRERCPVAQPENWTVTFASFSTDRYPLPLGIQVTVIGSADDFLLELRERMLGRPELLHEYDRLKVLAAPQGATAYWNAKNAFLQKLLADSSAMSESLRMVRLRLRPGRAVLTASSDPEREPPVSAGAGDEVVVSEKAAAFLIRQRAADVVERIELPESDRPPQ
jgi:GrpB-like predicted nucleotidyltransferase (UPF0157 family)